MSIFTHLFIRVVGGLAGPENSSVNRVGPSVLEQLVQIRVLDCLLHVFDGAFDFRNRIRATFFRRTLERQLVFSGRVRLMALSSVLFIVGAVGGSGC